MIESLRERLEAFSIFSRITLGFHWVLRLLGELIWESFGYYFGVAAKLWMSLGATLVISWHTRCLRSDFCLKTPPPLPPPDPISITFLVFAQKLKFEPYFGESTILRVRRSRFLPLSNIFFGHPPRSSQEAPPQYRRRVLPRRRGTPAPGGLFRRKSFQIAGNMIFQAWEFTISHQN